MKAGQEGAMPLETRCIRRGVGTGDALKSEDPLSEGLEGTDLYFCPLRVPDGRQEGEAHTSPHISKMKRGRVR